MKNSKIRENARQHLENVTFPITGSDSKATKGKKRLSQITESEVWVLGEIEPDCSIIDRTRCFLMGKYSGDN